MPDSFACPECGDELSLRGLSPGRQVRCRACRTLVEVPYIPRNLPTRRRFGGWSTRRALIFAGTLAVVVLAVLTASLALRQRLLGRDLERRKARVQAMLETARREQAGRDPGTEALARSLDQFDQAIALARSDRIDVPAKVQGERDETARRLVRGLIEASAGIAPRGRVASLRRLQEQARIDPALQGLRERIDRSLVETAEQAVRTGLAAAREAVAANDGRRAASELETVLMILPMLGASAAGTLEAETERVVDDLAARFGVVVEPISGVFIFGSSGSFTQELEPLIRDLLAERGYVDASGLGHLAARWPRQARFRLTLTVAETHVPYLDSALAGTRIAVTVTLGTSAATTWRTYVTGQTRIPPPWMPAYEAGRLASATRKDPEAERRLYQDARRVLLEQLRPRLTGLPPAAAPRSP